MVRQPIPVIIVAGFLGSGKTSLLNHLLRNPQGARIGVVVNDFGQINIDALSVAGQVDSSVSLSNGCLCCAVDPSGLDDLLAKLARPSSDIDLIVIESSGLADPRTMVRLLLGSTNPRLGYGGLVEVVDAAEFDRTRQRHPELDQHLRFADLVLLNKTDRVSEGDRDRLLELVRELADGRPVLPTAHGRIDPALLFDRESVRQRRETARQLTFDDLVTDDHDDCHEHLHAAYQSVEFTADEPVHPRALMRFLDTRPAGVYRMKGQVHFGVPGHEQKFTLHTVGDFLRFQRTRWARAEPRRTQLVVIGSGLDGDRIRADLHACLGRPEEDDEHSMLDVLKFIRG
ncbi:GTPase, G3E family [Saccharopolyspora kobensis]|uniref:GTPase, G3E family n=1 Tax=Saccharopolyspora kobensis TaxID=146035 RepID=A0A1H5XK36_9PSEU|nr:GTP-binding protein [Saccharopolyspora kobensis]SEG11707.1 GTPase, G3E family [Saccharopolyspora kobensis]SFE42041.1 GTPase, G3E family [Saccharopolyspora kobensis]